MAPVPDARPVLRAARRVRPKPLRRPIQGTGRPSPRVPETAGRLGDMGPTGASTEAAAAQDGPRGGSPLEARRLEGDAREAGPPPRQPPGPSLQGSPAAVRDPLEATTGSVRLGGTPFAGGPWRVAGEMVAPSMTGPRARLGGHPRPS